MKKAIFAAVAVLAAVLASGCGGRNSGNTGKTAASQENTQAAADASGPVGAAGEDVITIKLGHVEAEDRSTHQALVEYFKKPIEEKSGGKIRVDIHPNGSLGGDIELTESVAMGTLDAALPSTSVLVSYADEFGVMDIPWLFNDSQAAFDSMDGDMGAFLNGKLDEVGIHCLGYSYNGLRSMTNGTRPITAPEDLKGLKMRVMENQVYIDFFNALGASATPMSFNELYTGLQQHTVDGEENPPSLIYAMKFHEVQKYLSLTEHTHNFLAFIMNKDFYGKLSAEQQQLVSDAAAEFVRQQRQLELAETQEYIEKLKADGIEVNELSAEQKQVFKETLAPFYEKYREKYGEEIFGMAEKYNQ